MSCSLRDGKGPRITGRGSPRQLVADRMASAADSPAASSRTECARRCAAVHQDCTCSLTASTSGLGREDDVDRKAHESGVHEPCVGRISMPRPRASLLRPIRPRTPTGRWRPRTARRRSDLLVEEFERAHKCRQYRGATSDWTGSWNHRRTTRSGDWSGLQIPIPSRVTNAGPISFESRVRCRGLPCGGGSSRSV